MLRKLPTAVGGIVWCFHFLSSKMKTPLVTIAINQRGNVGVNQTRPAKVAASGVIQRPL